MNDIIKLRSIDEIEEEAAAWVWRLDTDRVSETDQKAFDHWMQRDPRHRRAIQELKGIWGTLDALAEAKREEKIATFIADHERGKEKAGVRTGLRVIPLALAAAVLVSIVLLVWLQRGNERQTLATAVGQQRTVILADGSTIYLNTNTNLETHFNSTQRDVKLLKGEALFKVAHDRQRPFLVRAGTTVVRAVGTEFNVRVRDARDIEVIVSEGRVEVESMPKAIAPSEAHKSLLIAGQRFDTADAEPVAAMNTELMTRTLAWREGAIVFDGEPLSEAVSELNRYTDTRFIVNDPTVREMKVGGRFRAGDIDEFLLALKKALPVTTRRTGDNLVYIERR